MDDALTLLGLWLGLWLGAIGITLAGHFVYRCIYHARRSLKIARAMSS